MGAGDPGPAGQAGVDGRAPGDFGEAGDAAVELGADDRAADEALAVLKGYMAEWNAVGHVPFKEKDKIYKQYHTAVDGVFDNLNTNASNKKLNNFKFAINSMQGGNQSLYREREKLSRQYENMKNELLTYENNLGFLSSSSQKGNSLLTEINRKVDKLKTDLEVVLQKIKMIDESLQHEE